jgi:hypothetical protein
VAFLAGTTEIDEAETARLRGQGTA